MKTKLTTIILALTTGLSLAHEGIELGPNKGRILELSTNESIHGEVTEKDGKLHIALLDKDMKPVKADVQSLTATAGSREKPVKLEVTQSESGFTIPTPTAGDWIILQFKNSADQKPITARMHYNIKICDPCKQPEWRCACE